MKGTKRPDSIETRRSLEATADGPDLRAVQLADTQEPGVDILITTWWTIDDRGTFFLPGSFTKTLKERAAEAPVLYAHDYYDALPIGVTDEKNSKETDQGVVIRALIDEEQTRGAEVMGFLRFAKSHGKRGLGASFGFDTVRQRSATEADRKNLDFSVAPSWTKMVPITDLYAKQEVRYWEASLLVFGSNANAGPVAVRGIDPGELRALLAAVKDGKLEPDQRALMGEIVAAWTAGLSITPTTAPDALRRRERELELAFIDLPFEMKEGIGA